MIAFNERQRTNEMEWNLPKMSTNQLRNWDIRQKTAKLAALGAHEILKNFLAVHSAYMEDRPWGNPVIAESTPKYSGIGQLFLGLLNNGFMGRYFHTDSHAAIISDEICLAVQRKNQKWAKKPENIVAKSFSLW